MRLMPFRIAGCALLLAHAIAYAATAEVFVSEGELNYVGTVDGEANQRLFAIYDKLPTKPTTLAIQSRGGDVEFGLELGEWVRDHRLDVKVTEFCLSSCANYVFTAGKIKTVSNSATIGFHGGLSSQHVVDSTDFAGFSQLTDAQKTSVKLDLQRKLERESRFFQSVGVRQALTTFGQQERFANIVRDGWTFTLNCFEQFGVNNIEVVNPPWVPKPPDQRIDIVILDCPAGG
ncbi:MAG TPA: hypothetical protein VFX55_06710 [Duganella sp.]|nr:hypothetical protein [Duganella sp.]